MNLIDKLKDKNHKNSYKHLLNYRTELDDISLKVSLVYEKINTLNNLSLISFNKANNYIDKIIVAYNKNNIPLSKYGFIKYTKETIFLENINNLIKSLLEEFNSINESLLSLQDSYNTLSDSLYKDSKLSFKSLFSNPTLSFSKDLKILEDSLLDFSKKIPSKKSLPNSFYSSTPFLNDEMLESSFNKFLQQHLC